ncbi:hypothetical protein J8I87_11110 [Paraburkholderia sp. LEh10]|uniref:hypothetical protein n=1 Tax=Paraburkholderia sp. LEh10 TaxID=2821353 RepID=UPI001AE972E6|nr:hypothetical protein [Paraburkholderia sp. LEh10]
MVGLQESAHLDIGRKESFAHPSIFDVPGGLTAMLLGLSFILPAMRVTLLVGGPTILLRVASALTCFLPNVTPCTALLRLLGCPRIPGRRRQKDRGERSGEPSISQNHDAISLYVAVWRNAISSMSSSFVPHGMKGIVISRRRPVTSFNAAQPDIGPKSNTTFHSTRIG